MYTKYLLYNMLIISAIFETYKRGVYLIKARCLMYAEWTFYGRGLNNKYLQISVFIPEMTK